MRPASVACGTPKYLPSTRFDWSVDGMNSSLRPLTYSDMSSSHFWAANSAPQITSEKKMSHSPDFARWRWTNWLRCSSADSGNSLIVALRPCPAYFALKSLTDLICAPDVSLPVQYVTLPVAPFASASVGAFFAPETFTAWDPPPPDDDEDDPHPARARAVIAGTTRPRRDIALLPRRRLPEAYPGTAEPSPGPAGGPLQGGGQRLQLGLDVAAELQDRVVVVRRRALGHERDVSARPERDRRQLRHREDLERGARAQQQ